MIAPAEWKEVRRWWRRTLPFYAVCTAAPDGRPHVAPVGSVMLNDDGTGYYFEIFLQHTAQHLNHDPRVTVMALQIMPWFWARALFTGRFAYAPALRLIGTAEAARPSTERERKRWYRRVGPVRRLKGPKMWWGDLDTVRPLRFERVAPVQLGASTQGLWPPPAGRG